jgi:hypothetical protein
MNHIATAEPSASGVDYSLLIMEAAMAVKMAVKTAVEMAPGAIPRPGRVPKQSSVPRIGVSRWRRRPWSLSGVSSIGTAFLGRKGFYRRRGGAGGHLGAPHHRVARAQARPRRPMVWWPSGPSPTLLRCSGAFREK